MLSTFKHILDRQIIVLGSQSPRRQQILRDNLGLSFRVIVSTFNEDIPKETCRGASDYVMKTCRMKAIDIVSKLEADFQIDNTSVFPDLIICSDTIVVYNDKILEKPATRDEAFTMLTYLSGNVHNVLTSVTIAYLKSNVKSTMSSQDINNINSTTVFNADNLPNPSDYYHLHTFYESTNVKFDTLTPESIHGYIDSNEPFDKAGNNLYILSFYLLPAHRLIS